MSSTNTSDIQKLNRCLLSGNPVLFTGAGFSLGASKADGVEIPSGSQLKAQIIGDLLGIDKSQAEYEELDKASLSEVCSYASSVLSELRFRDFIVEHLSGFRPQSYHETILSFSNWRKIYTVNIDDVVENSQCSNRFIVQNTHRKIDYSKATKIEYIKLHGCVRNADGDIVFSNNQYVDSMLHSTDYRFNSFAQDMQVENFIILGTEMREINLDYYIELFSSTSGKTVHGQLFFINPNPSHLFIARVQTIGAIVIQWTTQQFAEHISGLGLPLQKDGASVFIKDFLDIGSRFKVEKSFVNYKSELYFGNYPCLKDIVFDWDFRNPLIDSIIDSIKSVKGKQLNRRMIALYGKSVVGKSLYLKRIAVSLLQDNYIVYEFCGKEFDVRYFATKVALSPETNFALIVDDASFYYREIAYLMRLFPLNKKLVVITASRSYQHFRKRYCIVSESWFEEFYINGETSDDAFAANIADRLDEKGLLGRLKADGREARISKIKGFNDVSAFLYSITNGRYYQQRMINRYLNLPGEAVLEHEFLIQLSFFFKLNLPFFPAEIFQLIYGKNAGVILSKVEDYLTYFADRNGYAIRSPFLVPHILKSVSYKKRVRLLSEVLMYVSPQVVDGYHSYWNEIASTLMKCKLLRRFLGLPNGFVKQLLSLIKSYYNDDYNYWLQVGLSEQYDNDFDRALNHFQQAESLSPKSYLVKNAIARNYLRQAYVVDNRTQADFLFNEGVRRMKELIREREEFQVRAYSTHCLLYEEIRYFRKYNVKPSEEVLNEMYKSLRLIFDKNPDDPMSRHISNVFFVFVSDNSLNSKLPKMTLQDLSMFKSVMKESEITEKDLLENFELDE